MNEMNCPPAPRKVAPERSWSEISASKVRLFAARRIGELCPPEKPGPKANKNSPELRENFPESQRLSEFRKLAEIPISRGS